MLFSCKPLSTLSDLEDQTSSLLAASYVFGTPETLKSKNSVIHGFITAARSPYYRPFLKAGSIVRVSSFEVAKCTNMYKITDHPFLIRFIPQTTIHEVVDSAPIINGEKFMLRKFDPLRSLANTNLELPDVVGKIQSVQGSDLTDAGVTTRVVVRLVIDPSQLAGRPNREGFTCIDTKNGIKKKEVVSIGELNKFITNSDEQTQEADFICKARVVEVLQQNGWSFISCTGCSKKLEKIGSSLRCRRCANPNVTGVIKYRVELCVDDGVDNATFVVFDREMVKLTKQDAAGLTLTEMNGGGERNSQCVRDLAGKELVFRYTLKTEVTEIVAEKAAKHQHLSARRLMTRNQAHPMLDPQRVAVSARE
ncbi:hypothetical protein Bca4012_019705 [Brassica carinata]